MSAELMVYAGIFVMGLLVAAAAAVVAVRCIRARRSCEYIVEDDFISESVAPILRWNLRGAPCALNRRRSADSLETMDFGESHEEMLEALRTRDELPSRLAAQILGHMDAQNSPHAWT